MGLWSALIRRLPWRRGRPSRRDFLSLVFLLDKPRRASDPEVTGRISRKWQKRLGLEQAPAVRTFPLGSDGGPPGEAVVWDGLPFAVMSVEGRYCPETPEGVSEDLRLSEPFERHAGWIAVDWMMPASSPEEVELAYRALGEVLAEYEGADVLLVYDKEEGRLVPYAPSVPERLRSEFPRSVFEETQMPVLRVGDDEAALLDAAAKEARLRFQEFVTAFECRTPEQIFSVKTDFRERAGEEERVEWMWIDVEELTPTAVVGTIGNEPRGLTTFRIGDRVELSRERVVDWMYTTPQGPEEYAGGFSVKVFESSHRG